MANTGRIPCIRSASAALEFTINLLNVSAPAAAAPASALRCTMMTKCVQIAKSSFHSSSTSSSSALRRSSSVACSTSLSSCSSSCLLSCGGITSFLPQRSYQYVSPYWNTILPQAPKKKPYPAVTPMKVFERDEYALRKSKYANLRLRSLRGQFPASIAMREGKVRKDINIAVPLREFEKETRKAFIFNRVFEFQIHQPPPTLAEMNAGYGPHAPQSVPITDPMPKASSQYRSVLVVPTFMQRHPLTRSIVGMIFCEFIPGRVNRIKMPVNYLNEYDGPAAKKGANVSTFDAFLEMEWEGGVEIPEELTVDLAEAKLGHTVRLRDISLPTGLTPFRKNRDFILATVRSTKEKVLTEEEEKALEDAEKAAAAPTPAAAGAEKKAEGEEGEEKAPAAPAKKK